MNPHMFAKPFQCQKVLHCLQKSLGNLLRWNYLQPRLGLSKKWSWVWEKMWGGPTVTNILCPIIHAGSTVQ